MKNFILFFSAIILLSSCVGGWGGESLSGNGNVTTETRNVQKFEGVKTTGSIDVEIKPGEGTTVVVEDDENILSSIETEVEGGTLNIHYKRNTSVSNDHAKVYITTGSLNKIITSGSANIIVNGVIKDERKIEVKVSGSGDIDAGVDAPQIEASIGGSGNISLHGRTKEFHAKISGSGNLNCGDLQSESTTIRIAGSGNAHVFASVHLEARVSGSGNVYYRGNPKSPEIHTAGSGTIQPE